MEPTKWFVMMAVDYGDDYVVDMADSEADATALCAEISETRPGGEYYVIFGGIFEDDLIHSLNQWGGHTTGGPMPTHHTKEDIRGDYKYLIGVWE